MSNERDARYFDIYRYDSASYERTLVYKNEHGHFRRHLGRRQVGGDDEAQYHQRQRHLSVECRHQALTHLTRTGRGAFSPATFDPASRYLYYLSNEGSEFTRLRRYSLAAGTHEDVEKPSGTSRSRLRTTAAIG